MNRGCAPGICSRVTGGKQKTAAFSPQFVLTNVKSLNVLDRRVNDDENPAVGSVTGSRVSAASGSGGDGKRSMPPECRFKRFLGVDVMPGTKLAQANKQTNIKKRQKSAVSQQFPRGREVKVRKKCLEVQCLSLHSNCIFT